MKFIFPQKVLFKHCDPAGIVFYPRYFEMINDCVEAFFDEIGFPFAVLHRNAGVPTAQIEAVFKAPSRHGDQLEIALSATRVGGASLGLAFLAKCSSEPRFTATATLVHTDVQGRPEGWPDDMRRALTNYIRSEQ